MKHARLLEFIRSHGIEAYAREDGQLAVLLLWTRGQETGETWETIPATLQAARDWLGY